MDNLNRRFHRAQQNRGRAVGSRSHDYAAGFDSDWAVASRYNYCTYSSCVDFEAVAGHVANDRQVRSLTDGIQIGERGLPADAVDVAGGLALMTAPNASAAQPSKLPGFCGNSYAMLMTGFEPNLNPATGSSAAPGFPGALTGIVGVGVIQFSSDCSSIGGELIYNDGDIQFLGNGDTAGVSAGPAACYSAEKLLVSVPCFDRGNHFTGGSVTTAGEPPGMALLQFAANFGSYDYGLGTNPPLLPFTFLIQETTGDTTLVGNTVASPTDTDSHLDNEGAVAHSGPHYVWQESLCWRCGAGTLIAAFINGIRNSSTRKSPVVNSTGVGPGVLSSVVTLYVPSFADCGIRQSFSALLHLRGKS